MINEKILDQLLKTADGDLVCSLMEETMNFVKITDEGVSEKDKNSMVDNLMNINKIASKHGLNRVYSIDGAPVEDDVRNYFSKLLKSNLHYKH